MEESSRSPVVLKEGRFSRFDRIEWWDQSLLRNARILVVGAGALGNEVIKNLALLGAGNMVIVDKDHVELSNLSRSVLFRQTDEGKPKAECAAKAIKSIYPEIHVKPIVGNVLADVGLGYFRWAQVIVGALDNREARVFLNSSAARVGKPWIDGGIDVLNGIVRGFSPPETPCYECTMSKQDWDLLNQRRSCSLLARRALDQNGTPTTPTTASVIGAIQAQEVIKLLHGMEALLGRGFVFEGAKHSSYVISYLKNPDCVWHDSSCPVAAMYDLDSETTFQMIWDRASKQIGPLDAIDFSREIVDRLDCPSCRHAEKVLQPLDKIDESRILCKHCGSECSPIFLHSVGVGSNFLKLTVRQLGLPLWDIVWARCGDTCLGLEITGDKKRERFFDEY